MGNEGYETVKAIFEALKPREGQKSGRMSKLGAYLWKNDPSASSGERINREIDAEQANTGLDLTQLRKGKVYYSPEEEAAYISKVKSFAAERKKAMDEERVKRFYSDPEGNIPFDKNSAEEIRARRAYEDSRADRAAEAIAKLEEERRKQKAVEDKAAGVSAAIKGEKFNPAGKSPDWVQGFKDALFPTAQAKLAEQGQVIRERQVSQSIEDSNRRFGLAKRGQNFNQGVAKLRIIDQELKSKLPTINVPKQYAPKPNKTVTTRKVGKNTIREEVYSAPVGTLQNGRPKGGTDLAKWLMGVK